MPVEEVARRKEELYLESLPSLKAVPEVLEHINMAVSHWLSFQEVPASLCALRYVHCSCSISLRPSFVLETTRRANLIQRLF